MQRACTKPPPSSATTVILTSVMARSNSGSVRTEKAVHRPVATRQGAVKAATGNASCWRSCDPRPASNDRDEELRRPYTATTSRLSRHSTRARSPHLRMESHGQRVPLVCSTEHSPYGPSTAGHSWLANAGHPTGSFMSLSRRHVSLPGRSTSWLMAHAANYVSSDARTRRYGRENPMAGPGEQPAPR